MIPWYWLFPAFLAGFVAAVYLLLWNHDLVRNAEDAVSFGQVATGSLNPTGDDRTDKLNSLYAEAIDILHDMRLRGTHIHTRIVSVAITETETAQMWALKAATWGKETS